MDCELPGGDHPECRAVRAWFEANPNPSGRDLAQAGYVVPHWSRHLCHKRARVMDMVERMAA